MAAKLLHSLADDNPDLQKQIGCMNGIFQIFDRHQVLTGRRISHHKRLPPGNSHYSNGGLERESNNPYHRQAVTDINSNKIVNEKQRLSTESSRASFSSTCSSSLSSLECNRTAQPGTSSFDRIIFPETPPRDPVTNHSSNSPRFGRQSLDLRDVVKDSMHREARGLSLKTTTRDEAAGNTVKCRDSPRPLKLSRPTDGSDGVRTNEKQNMPADLKESLRVLAQLREAPWHYEDRDHPRSTYESKDSFWHTVPKDAPRFSYDGREMNRLSFESRDTCRSTPKPKELPRLSLDSREGSMRGSQSDSRSNHLSKGFRNSGSSNGRDPSLPQSSGTQSRPSVVAKLMGLEALPDSDSNLSLIKTSPVIESNPFSKPLKTNNLYRPIHTSNSLRSSPKEPTSPRWKNPDLVMRPVSSSRFPIEPAPWKMQDGNRGYQSSKPEKAQGRTQNSFPSVYSEIEKRLNDLEFKQSGKDLRALKQILEAMQVKGLLETKKEQQASNFETQKDCEPECSSSNPDPRSVNQRNRNSHAMSSRIKSSDSSKNYGSPIVIIKPAKVVEKSGLPSSSLISMDGLSDVHTAPRGGTVDNKRVSTNSRTAKDHSPKNSRKDSSVGSIDKKPSGRNVKSLPKENSATNSAKSSGSVSPRLQQKKLELGKPSRPPTPPSDTRKPRRQSSRQSTDATSPGRKLRPKSSNLQQSDDQLSEISNESRRSSFQGDDIDMEESSSVRGTDTNDCQSPSLKASKYLASASMQQKLTARLEEDGSAVELATVGPEHPSPVSVLDTSAYRDDALSPVKQLPDALRGDDAEDSNLRVCEDQWNPADNLASIGSGLTSEINRKKLQNIENLVQKLRRLNSSHDEARTDYIASLCENSNPDHRYISEILLASGLLLRDLGSSLTTFQLHPSGHPINPELFFVLEQTKASSMLAKEECIPEKATHAKQEKFHRKLIFDAVNEILVDKLGLVGSPLEPWLKPARLAKKTLNAQKLLKELFFEIEQFQAKKLECNLEDEDDGLKSILCEDVMHRSESWTVFHAEISGAVLDVERLIFKDLIDEIVIGEAASLRAKPAARRRKLFAK
ncbi:protein LONGIFOLIA 1 isoform X1 [Rosa chinensis]|uniref:protein LONGIFOLIA 1 isoform X1 n=1 Tax=Rosa chinensis TaxID=74649 RepID=UPI000D091E7F|nr:protein LONGIFOLIA 1 isoform X1 [Rosa chinensis]XP_040366415.1 protein LONGIFOLIA 1 isoform X1 [Rosa chinensis]XP_040366416.1 protein LONGIFOLIA 1 isoform X1 [Rosa chinensis]